MPKEGKDFLIGGLSPQLNGLARQSAMEALANTKLSNNVKQLDKQTATAKEQQQAASQFEALLLQQMFQAMWQTVPKDGLFAEGSEQEYYRDMFNEGLAESIAQGKGIGIKDVLIRELKRSAVSDEPDQ